MIIVCVMVVLLFGGGGCGGDAAWWWGGGWWGLGAINKNINYMKNEFQCGCKQILMYSVFNILGLRM